MSMRYYGSIEGPVEPTVSQTTAIGAWRMHEQMQALYAGNWPLYFAPDPYFNYVNTLLPGNGPNGGQNNTFIDSSTSAATVTRSGNPTQGTFTPFNYQYSAYFNAATGYTLSVASSSVFAFGTGDFTVEAWINLDAIPAVNRDVVTFSNNSATLYFQSSGILRWYDGGNKAASSVTLEAGKWYHVAAVRQSTNVTVYVNGVGGTPGADTGSYVASGVNIGSYTSTSTELFQGYISNVRITNTAVYTSNFTPPTSPLTAISGTLLLTCQNNRFIDNSANNFTVTNNSLATVSAFNPFGSPTSYSATNYGGTFYNNATLGNYLSVPYNTSVCQWWTSDFTIEAWIFPAGSSLASWYNASIPAAMGCMNATTATAATWAFGPYTTTGAIKFYYYNGAAVNTVITTATAQLNRWTHIAMSLSGTTIRLFVNGVYDSIYTVSGTPTVTANPFLVGQAANNPINGYISGLRVVKGTALYTATFTIPTAPPTPVTNTTLLLNYTNSSIVDNSMLNHVETVGTAQTSTTQSKFGGSSMYFDGSAGNYLTIPNSQQNQLGTGDFTIEGWVYRLATGVQHSIWAKGTATTGVVVYISAGNKLAVGYSATGNNGTTNINVNTWYHFAVVRSGTAIGNIKVYLNGVLEASSGTAVTTAFTQTNPIYVGADRTATTPMNGYIDDLRVTRYARYTANFTPPTQAYSTFGP